MKIQLDTDRKTIKIEDNVLLSKLIETLDALLPNKEWKKFTLETNVTINHWNSPIVIKEYPVYPKPYWPWYSSGSGVYMSDNKALGMKNADYKVNGNSDEKLLALKGGIYNLEVK